MADEKRSKGLLFTWGFHCTLPYISKSSRTWLHVLQLHCTVVRIRRAPSVSESLLFNWIENFWRKSKSFSPYISGLIISSVILSNPDNNKRWLCPGRLPVSLSIITQAWLLLTYSYTQQGMVSWFKIRLHDWIAVLLVCEIERILSQYFSRLESILKKITSSRAGQSYWKYTLTDFSNQITGFLCKNRISVAQLPIRI